MPKLVTLILSLCLLFYFSTCAEVVVNVANLPDDSILTISARNPIALVIPNRNTIKSFNIRHDGRNEWINSTLGCYSRLLNITFDKPYYVGNSTQKNDIQNLKVIISENYRVANPLCQVGAIYPYLDSSSYTLCNCTNYWFFSHTGVGAMDGTPIPDSYYPMIVRITPEAPFTTTLITGYCKSNVKPVVCLTKNCTCSNTGGTNYDESYFIYGSSSSTKGLASSTTQGYGSRLSSSSRVSSNLILVILLICFILYLQ